MGRTRCPDHSTGTLSKAGEPQATSKPYGRANIVGVSQHCEIMLRAGLPTFIWTPQCPLA